MQLGMKMHQLIVSEDFVDTLLLTRAKVLIIIGLFVMFSLTLKIKMFQLNLGYSSSIVP